MFQMAYFCPNLHCEELGLLDICSGMKDDNRNYKVNMFSFYHLIIGVLLISFEELWLYWVSCRRPLVKFRVTTTFWAMVM